MAIKSLSLFFDHFLLVLNSLVKEVQFGTRGPRLRSAALGRPAFRAGAAGDAGAAMSFDSIAQRHRSFLIFSHLFSILFISFSSLFLIFLLSSFGSMWRLAWLPLPAAFHDVLELDLGRLKSCLSHRFHIVFTPFFLL